MTGIAETPLGGQLINVLTDPSELQQFIQWFSNALWEAESGNDIDVLPAFRKVENLLYSYLDGDWSKETFMGILRREVATLGVSPGAYSVRVEKPSGPRTGAGQARVYSPFGSLISFAKPPEVASGS